MLRLQEVSRETSSGKLTTYKCDILDEGPGSAAASANDRFSSPR